MLRGQGMGFMALYAGGAADAGRHPELPGVRAHAHVKFSFVIVSVAAQEDAWLLSSGVFICRVMLRRIHVNFEV